MTDTIQPLSRELRTSALSGWFMLLVNFALLFGGIALLIYETAFTQPFERSTWLIALACLIDLLAIICFGGYFTLQPNEGRVLILFGKYHGTVRESGFFWANPFYARSRTGEVARRGEKLSIPTAGSTTKISLRARNFNSDKLKVND